jgi:phosphoglycerate dehydrogenase-like enzyme
MPTILIGSGPLRRRPGRFRDILHAEGFRCLDPPGELPVTEDQLRAILPEISAILAGGERITAELLDLAPGLRVIARTGVGFDLIDIEAATAHRVAVTITPGTNQLSVAEHTFALLLALTRRIVVNDRTIRAGGWDRTLVAPLRGQTMGLVGLGRIGRAVAQLARAFQMRVLAFDPVTDPDFDARYEIRRISFQDILAESDIVSLHLPLSEASRGLINRASLARMRPGSILINTSRGGLVVEADLHDSLVAGHLAGAGLDVLTSEPPEPGHPLMHLPNVVFTPHIAGTDSQSMADMADLAAQCVISLARGVWPDGCVVNDELAPTWRW